MIRARRLSRQEKWLRRMQRHTKRLGQTLENPELESDNWMDKVAADAVKICDLLLCYPEKKAGLTKK